MCAWPRSATISPRDRVIERPTGGHAAGLGRGFRRSPRRMASAKAGLQSPRPGMNVPWAGSSARNRPGNSSGEPQPSASPTCISGMKPRASASASRPSSTCAPATTCSRGATAMYGCRALWIPSQGHQRRAPLNLIGIVEVQYAHRGPSLWCEAIDYCPSQTKMVFPAIPSGMEQGGNGACPWINRGEVAAFVPVAYPATQAEVIFNRLAVMLFSDNMVDLVGIEADGVGEQTVFAPFARAITYQATQ